MVREELIKIGGGSGSRTRLQGYRAPVAASAKPPHISFIKGLYNLPHLLFGIERGVARVMSRLTLSELIRQHWLYPSRKRILHRVKEMQQIGRMLHLTLDCGAKVVVRDSRRGRAARWLSQMIYWRECKECRFLEKPSKKFQPKKPLKELTVAHKEHRIVFCTRFRPKQQREEGE